MARSLTTRSTNPKIMDDNIKILDYNLGKASAPDAEDVVYDNTDSGLTADDVQAAIDEVASNIVSISNSVSKLNSNIGNISGNSNKNLIIPYNCTGLLLLSSADTDTINLLIIHSASDSIIYKPLATSSGLTITAITNGINISNTKLSTLFVRYISLRGDIPAYSE